MAYKYATVGPPFNFQGNLSETQRNAFQTWVEASVPSLPEVQVFHQIRSHQLRKTAGILEKYYASAAPDPLAPTFVKASWTPGPDGHWPYAKRNDHAPSVVVAGIKKIFHSRLVHQDDAVFHMNHLRTQIEHQEDLATRTFEGITNTPALLGRLNTLFGQPEYQATLVKDISDLYKGQPRFRVHPLDDPTPWEIDTRTGNTPTFTS